MQEQNPESRSSRLINGYKHMLRLVHDGFASWQKKVQPKLKEQLHVAKAKSQELGQLSEAESDKIASYLERDLQGIAEFILDAEDLISERFYAELSEVEKRLWNLSSTLADKTTLDYLDFKEQMQHDFEYHTGEIIGLGNLQCDQCEQVLHFIQISHIPPCPKCNGTKFFRIFSS